MATALLNFQDTPSGDLLALSFVVTTTALVWVTVKIKEKSKQKETSPFPGIPVAPGAHWLFGHVLMMFRPNGFDGSRYIYQEYADKSTGLCAFWSMNERGFSVLNGKDAKAILQSSRTKPGSKNYLTHHVKKFLGKKNLVHIQGNEWRIYRSAIHKSFTPVVMKQCQEFIGEVGTTLAEPLLKAIKSTIGSDPELKREVLPLMKMATSDVFFGAMLGVDLQACAQLGLPDIINSVEILANDLGRRIKAFDVTASQYFLPTSANREHARHRHAVRSYVMGQLTCAREQKSSRIKNLLSEVWKAAEKEAAAVGRSVDIETVGDVAMSLLFGGYDTTSSTLSYAIYLLVKNPTAYKTCLEEIDSVLGTVPAHKLSGPEQLPYTQAVFSEALRLFPPVFMAFRALEKDITLHGHTFPKGTRCSIPTWLIQRHEMNFPQPLEMRPDRWVRPSAVDMDSPGVSRWEVRPTDDMTSSDIAPGNHDAFLAFSQGGRNCPGKSLATREAVTILACLLHKIQFELVDASYEVNPTLTLVNQPDDGLPMIMKARKEE